MKDYCEKVVCELQRKSSEHSVEYKPVTKNNSVVKNAISIHQADENISPVFYVFEDDRKKWTPKEFADVLWDRYLYEMKNKPDFDVSRFEDVDFIKNNVVFDIVNRKRNGDEYVNIPLTEELMVTFKVRVAEQGYVRLRDSQLGLWQGRITPEILLECAKENSAIVDKASFRPLENVLMDLIIPRLQNEMPDLSDEEIYELAKLRLGVGGLPLYVLTTEHGSNASLLYRGMIESMRTELNDDLVLIPSSTCELLVLSKGNANKVGYEQLRQMVEEVNRDIVIEEDETQFLSNELFIVDENGLREATYRDFSIDECR